MYLSDAIRQGSKLRPQGFNKLFSKDLSGNITSCAMGAAYEVVLGGFCRDTLVISRKVNELGWGSLLQKTTEIECELCGMEKTISHLNDYHMLTREDIADYIEELEYQMKLRIKIASLDREEDYVFV